MIQIINNILSSNGYEQVDIDIFFDSHTFYLFCPAEESKREEYFVTIQLQTQSDKAAQTILEKKAQELFEAISNSEKVSLPFEKNCTLLICHEEKNINRQTILAIEEDPYNFKKNVITYAPDELAALNTYFSKNAIKKITNDVINKIINAELGADFLMYKDPPKESKEKIKIYYSLILKIALKLPFITYCPQKRELTNLNSKIESSMSPNQSLIYSRLMETETEWTDENTYKQVLNIWGDS